jgi:hypothetical protein
MPGYKSILDAKVRHCDLKTMNVLAFSSASVRGRGSAVLPIIGGKAILGSEKQKVRAQIQFDSYVFDRRWPER